MKYYYLIYLTFALIFVNCSRQSPKPNIIFIMADDHAEKAISAYGYDFIETPNIDRLANEGMRFENSFVTNSICAPSRATILTGKYSHINGKKDNADIFDSDQQTFPKLLQKAGYQTAVIGKWHLKSEPVGFDYWNILPDQGVYYNPTFIEMGDTVQYEGYVTDLITDIVLKKLEERDKTKPFCYLYYHKAPHRNWMPALRYIKEFTQKKYDLPDNFYDDYSYRGSAAHEQDMEIRNMFFSSDMKLHPKTYMGYDKHTGGFADFNALADWELFYSSFTPEQKAEWDKYYDPINEEFKKMQPRGNELTEWMFQRYMQDYLGCIASIDENIGRLLDYLDKEGLSENTIVIYTSDQGFYLGEHGWYDKRFMYEQSLSMPLIIKYSGYVKPSTVSNELVLNLDMAPTLLELAGVDIPKDMQGASLAQILNGESPGNWRNSIYYHYYEYPHGWHKVKKHYGIRTDRYKLIHFYDDVDEWELYDLEEDPNEMNSLVNNPDYDYLVDSLKVELDKLEIQYKVK